MNTEVEPHITEEGKYSRILGKIF